MTKKNIVIITAGAVIIALLAAVYGIVSFVGNNKNEEDIPGNIPEETPVEKVFTANSPEKLSEIRLSKNGKTEYFIRKDAIIDELKTQIRTVTNAEQFIKMLFDKAINDHKYIAPFVVIKYL